MQDIEVANYDEMQGSIWKRYQCPYCPIRKISKSNLDDHIRTHTGERPFTCVVCGQTFKRRAHMRDHALNKHNIVLEKGKPGRPVNKK